MAILSAIILALLIFPASAQAYIDMSTGSMILQMLLGGIAGLCVAIKFYGRRFLSFFTGKKDSDTDKKIQGE